MALDNLVNLAYSLVTGAPSPPTSGTACTVQAGITWPTGNFDMLFWPPGDIPLLSNAEICRCSAVGNTITMTRGAYGTTEQAIAIGWQCAQVITADLFTEIVALINATVTSFNTRTGAVTLAAADIEGLFTAAGQLFVGTGSGTGSLLAGGATGTFLGANTGGAPTWKAVTSSVAATASEVECTTTGATQIVTYTPSGDGNFHISVYFRVVTATTVVTITVTWTDATGSQTMTLINAVSCATGSYSLTDFMINAEADAITVSMTAGTSNQVYGSASILVG
jgi:hypothetical protein